MQNNQEHMAIANCFFFLEEGYMEKKHVLFLKNKTGLINKYVALFLLFSLFTKKQYNMVKNTYLIFTVIQF